MTILKKPRGNLLNLFPLMHKRDFSLTKHLSPLSVYYLAATTCKKDLNYYYNQL